MASVPSARPLERARGARYERLEPIATGGMGKVYLGRVRGAVGTPTRTAAIKVMHPQLVQETDMVAMFLDEARISTRLRHPNIVEVWDMDLVGDELVIVMEYVEGTSFSQILRAARRDNSQVPIGMSGRIILDALAGLHAAHELRDEKGNPMGLVHRDVSPQNLLVGADGLTRLVDFGVALSAGRIASTAPDGAIKGKLSYLAPEQLTRKSVDRRLDVFAAGIVLWEALTGERLFSAATEAETVTQVLREPIAPPSSLRPDVPPMLDEVCLKALERDPARRFASASDFADALRAAVVPLAPPEDVGRSVLDVAGEAIMRRREALEKPETAAVLTDPTAALDVGDAPAKSTRRLVAVILVSVLGGALLTVFAVSFGSTRAGAGPVPSSTVAPVASTPSSSAPRPVDSAAVRQVPTPPATASAPSVTATATGSRPPPAWKPPAGYRPPPRQPSTYMPGEL